MSVLSHKTQKVSCAANASGNHPLDCCCTGAVNGHVDRRIIEREVEYFVFVPSDKKILVLLVIIIVVADEDLILGHNHSPLIV